MGALVPGIQPIAPALPTDDAFRPSAQDYADARRELREFIKAEFGDEDEPKRDPRTATVNIVQQ